MTDAYIPESWKNNCLTADYQRIANENRNITWVGDRPTYGGVIDVSYLFMYPTIMKEFKVTDPVEKNCDIIINITRDTSDDSIIYGKMKVIRNRFKKGK